MRHVCKTLCGVMDWLDFWIHRLVVNYDCKGTNSSSTVCSEPGHGNHCYHWNNMHPCCYCNERYTGYSSWIRNRESKPKWRQVFEDIRYEFWIRSN